MEPEKKESSGTELTSDQKYQLEFARIVNLQLTIRCLIVCLTILGSVYLFTKSIEALKDTEWWVPASIMGIGIIVSCTALKTIATLLRNKLVGEINEVFTKFFGVDAAEQGTAPAKADGYIEDKATLNRSEAQS